MRKNSPLNFKEIKALIKALKRTQQSFNLRNLYQFYQIWDKFSTTQSYEKKFWRNIIAQKNLQLISEIEENMLQVWLDKQNTQTIIQSSEYLYLLTKYHLTDHNCVVYNEKSRNLSIYNNFSELIFNFYFSHPESKQLKFIHDLIKSPIAPYLIYFLTQELIQNFDEAKFIFAFEILKTHQHHSHAFSFHIPPPNSTAIFENTVKNWLLVLEPAYLCQAKNIHYILEQSLYLIPGHLLTEHFQIWVKWFSLEDDIQYIAYKYVTYLKYAKNKELWIQSIQKCTKPSMQKKLLTEFLPRPSYSEWRKEFNFYSSDKEQVQQFLHWLQQTTDTDFYNNLLHVALNYPESVNNPVTQIIWKELKSHVQTDFLKLKAKIITSFDQNANEISLLFDEIMNSDLSHSARKKAFLLMSELAKSHQELFAFQTQFIKLFHHEKRAYRHLALTCLTLLPQNKQHLDFLLKSLSDPDIEVQRIAAKGLEKYKSLDSVSELKHQISQWCLKFLKQGPEHLTGQALKLIDDWKLVHLLDSVNESKCLTNKKLVIKQNYLNKKFSE